MISIEQLENFTGNVRKANIGARTAIGFLSDDPERIVRSIGYYKQLDVVHANERYCRMIDAWNEFGSYPGIRVPRYTPYKDFVLVVDWVYGQDLISKDFSPTEDQPAADRLIGFSDSLVQYAADKYRRGGHYVSDQKAEQYMYGRGASDSDEGVYFVDLDFEGGFINPNCPDRFELACFIIGISKILRVSERKIPGINILAAKNNMCVLIEEILTDYPDTYGISGEYKILKNQSS